ncbi:phage late control D family protein, partial [Psychrobacter sp. Pi2-51]|uniref:phage late control D family protein n=1 Tax=Psychrobacter sp. Pi2-51 TaxID=2774132 RepID=UPI0019184367
MPSQTARLHQITVETNNIPITTLYPAAFSWSSAIDKAATSQLLFYSHAFLDSNSCLSLVNTFVCLNTLSVSREPSHRTGLIKAVNYQHSDGALHFYTLDIVSPDWQLTQCIHTRSFINQSTLDIVTTLFADYEFDWQLSETLQSSERLSSQLPMRTQSDVSDWEFITGLLADSGVSTLWISGDSLDNLGCLMLLSSFDETELLPLDYRYAQSSIQSGQDTVNELQMRSQQLGSQTVMVRADGLSADTIYEGQATDESALAIDDTTVLLGAPSRVDSDSAATVLAQQWVNANRCQREHYQATGAMRGMVVGSPVSIHNLPTIGRLTSYCISTQMVGIEPDSDSVSYHNQAYIKAWLQRTTQQSGIFIPDHGYDIARDTGVWVSATLLDAAIPYAPYPSNLSFASHTYKGLTQARTGSATTPSYDSSVTDDNLQQTITTPVYSGISPHDDGTTPPLRALQLSSGSSHGWQFAPRLGQSVLLNHWYGDIDSPVISRSLYD